MQQVEDASAAAIVTEEARYCPLCGAKNACAVAACGNFATPCWCTQVKIAPQVLAQIAQPLRGKACICQACAGLL